MPLSPQLQLVKQFKVCELPLGAHEPTILGSGGESQETIPAPATTTVKRTRRISIRRRSTERWLPATAMFASK